MEELMELKQRLITLFDEFLSAPCYDTEEKLNEAIKLYRRKQTAIVVEGRW
jgi:ABC-type multidrug transport system fused ATPase/permease subunit